MNGMSAYQDLWRTLPNGHVPLEHEIRTGIAAVVAALFLASLSARAETLVRYTFEGQVLTPTTEHARISASDFGVGGDGTTAFLTGTGGSGTYSYRKTDWAHAGDDNPDDYFNFSVVVGEGFIASVTNLTFFEFKSANGPTNWIARYSTNDTDFFSMGSGVSHSGSFGATANECVDVEPIELSGTNFFRIYGTNAVDASGTWRIDTVDLQGVVSVDDGTRFYRYQSYDGGHHDTWGATTNAGNGTVVVTNSIPSQAGGEAPSGNSALQIIGSSDNSGPNVVFDNITLSTVSNPAVSVEFAAHDADVNDDLYLDVSYDNGTSWNGAGGTQLVDGSSGYDLPFGSTGTPVRVPCGENPYTFAVSAAETQISLRFRFQDDGGSPANDNYFIDSVTLSGIPEPSAKAPSVSNYGGVTNEGSDQATVSAHVRGGYPYPTVKIYWGPVDGGADTSGWNNETDLGVKEWGVVTNTLTSLQPGQVYYYRAYAENTHGSTWAGDTTNFSTTVSSIDTNRAVCLDALGIDLVMPLCIDLDGNDMSDSWETNYLGGTGNSGAGDPDGDGISNLRESWAGTDPNNPTSYLRIMSFDIPDATSSNLSISWLGGSHHGSTNYLPVGDNLQRSFRVFAASTSTGTKTLVTSVSDALVGTNSWVATNVVNQYSSRYYDVAVSTGEGGYTNTEEWAMHVQARATNASYIICVPVDLAAGSNNLNSTLGTQLARGLYASDTEAQADKLRWINGAGAWVEYYLSVTYGWTDNGSSSADVEITPGKAMWIVRGAGSASRPNTVFAGKSFTSSTVTNFTFSKDVTGGWTMFGWPLPTSRTHVGSDTSTNQLGFAALGVGGTTGIRTNSGAGDEIWVQNGSSWDWFWLVDSHSGPHAANGRWWLGDGGDFGDITLEVGKGYYYRHTTNWTSVNFDWTPEAP